MLIARLRRIIRFVVTEALQVRPDGFENKGKLGQDLSSGLQVTGLPQLLQPSRNRPERRFSHISGRAFDRVRPHLQGGGIGTAKGLPQGCELKGHIFNKRCHYQPCEVFVPHHPVHQFATIETAFGDVVHSAITLIGILSRKLESS